MNRVAQARLLASVLLLGVVLTARAAEQEPEAVPESLTESQIKSLLQHTDKQLEQVRKRHARVQADELNRWLQDYLEGTHRLSEAVEADAIEANDPEDILWKVDEAALKQRKLLERLHGSVADPAQEALEDALAAARRASRAALDALTRLREGTFQLGGKRPGPRIQQQTLEDIWVPGPTGPQRRPRPAPPPLR